MLEQPRRGLVIAYFLGARNIDRASLAARLDIPLSVLHQWERSQVDLPDDKLAAALDYIGISREDFDFHVTEGMQKM